MSLSKNSNMDALIMSAAHVLIEDTADYMRSIDTSDTVISKKLDKRIYKRIRQNSRENHWNRVPVTFKKIVAAVMVFCTISFALCMSVEAVRENVWNTILEWYDKFVAVFYVTDETPPSAIEEYREPTLQLAGTERQVIIQTESLNQIHYLLDQNLVMIYHQFVITDQSQKLDDEDGCFHETVRIGENEGNLLSYDDGRKTLTWHDNKYTYVIYLYQENIDHDMLLSIAESIR